MVNSQPKLAKSIIDQILYLLFWYAIVYIGRFVDQYADDRRAIGYQYAVLLPDKQTKLSRSTHCLKLVESWPGYPSRLSTSFRLRRSVGRMEANAAIDISIVITMNTPHKIVTWCGCLTYTHRKRALIKVYLLWLKPDFPFECLIGLNVTFQPWNEMCWDYRWGRWWLLWYRSRVWRPNS